MSTPIDDSVYGTSTPTFSGGTGVGAMVGTAVGAAGGRTVGAPAGAVSVDGVAGAGGAHAAESAAAEPAAAAPARRNLLLDRLTCWRSRRTWGPMSSIGQFASTG